MTTVPLRSSEGLIRPPLRPFFPWEIITSRKTFEWDPGRGHSGRLDVCTALLESHERSKSDIRPCTATVPSSEPRTWSTVLSIIEHPCLTKALHPASPAPRVLAAPRPAAVGVGRAGTPPNYFLPQWPGLHRTALCEIIRGPYRLTWEARWGVLRHSPCSWSCSRVGGAQALQPGWLDGTLCPPTSCHDSGHTVSHSLLRKTEVTAGPVS